ncbi:peptidylprolyl isomerase [Rufibacter glacialis]|uniref:peptidylprolyl isomerase n=1 Tax=Rufibacter glacialis TaxID=1259555 RepID=A0A5M8QKS0_9BACT|nr:peptidylprolyl isomerase [Rufibacter glacialis]KAA6435828.1 peptidylprolyl isomerase [Rufibacter glacialis]GGK66937.1 peptidyl-prolyl cis-trans isomerase [Rufibacter glacialis]
MALFSCVPSFGSKIFLLFSLALLCACGQKQDPPTQANTPPPAPEPALLTQETAVDSLTAYGKAHPHDTLVLISTPKGDIKIRLYKDTPLHRANFVRLANYGFFDKTVFFRVEKDFMIQGGRSDFQTMKIGTYKIPAEIKPHYFHKRGAVGMARYGDDENPERMSSNKDFYIVQGHKLPDYELQATIKEFKLNLTPAQKQVYRTQGGAPNLDQTFTVIGEVVEGMAVVDSIAAVPVDQTKWPLKDVGMQVRVVK